MSIIAIRRNLSPGAVFFRQTGQIVEYSLDNVTWRPGFVLPRDPGGLNIPEYVTNNIENVTLNEFITNVQGVFQGTFTTPELETVINNPATRIEQNLCAGANVLAATFVALVNYRLEDEADEQTGLIGAGADIAALALELVKFKFKTKFLEQTLKWINRAIVGATATSVAATWYESLDGVADLTDCDLEAIACAIYQSLRGGGTIDKDTVAASLIVHDAIGMAQACGASNLNTPLVEWFSGWIDEWPELWSNFLIGLTDGEFIGCSCGGCDDILPWDCDIQVNSGYKLLSGGIQTTPNNTPYAPTNYKYLSLQWTPPVVPSGLVDRVELTYAVTQFLKASSLNWGTTTIINCTLRGVNAAGFPAVELNKQISEVAPVALSNTVNQGGLKTHVFDFSGIAQGGAGLTRIDFSIRTAYQAAAGKGVGADAVFLGGRVCYQTP